MKLLSYILFEKYIYILALEMASPGNRHCTSCIGTLSFPLLLLIPECFLLSILHHHEISISMKIHTYF